jgi:IclR family acetate operon transcriptional repressor
MFAELEIIRDRGYSIDRQERDLGVMCIAVPIPNDARLNVALSVAGPTGELGEAERERYLPILRETARQLGENPRFIASLGAAHGRSPLEAQP